jgi:hypothetical protein
MINNTHLCDGNNISTYSKPSSDKTMDHGKRKITVLELKKNVSLLASLRLSIEYRMS